MAENKEHVVFSEIANIREFYKCLSDTCYSFIPTGAPGAANYASYIYWSLRGTLESIGLLLQTGNITDAYTLVRKYYDDILIEIYFDVVRKDKFDWMTNSVVKDIDNWIKREQWIPRIERILTVLKESDSTKDIYPMFAWDTTLKHHREILDGTVHTSSFGNILLNCKDLATVDRQKHMADICGLLRELFTLHLAFIFHLNSHYMMASDYTDYLEVGMTPPEGTERLIAPYAQRAYDTYIKPHARLAAFIRERCSLDIV